MTRPAAWRGVVRCMWCQGKGWVWMGEIGNAYRDTCPDCKGRRHGTR